MHTDERHEFHQLARRRNSEFVNIRGIRVCLCFFIRVDPCPSVVEMHRSELELRGFGFEVEDFRDFEREGAVVGVGRHQFAHVRPPAAADVRRGDGGPLGFVRKLDVGEELARFRVEEDRVGADAVLEKRGLQLRPDGLMTAQIFRLAPGVDGHDECFSNHGSSSFLLRRRTSSAGSKLTDERMWSDSLIMQRSHLFIVDDEMWFALTPALSSGAYHCAHIYLWFLA